MTSLWLSSVLMVLSSAKRRRTSLSTEAFRLLTNSPSENGVGKRLWNIPQTMGSMRPIIGIVSQAGRYGGTFAQTDIAFEFASWISVEFRLYLVMEFQRLKAKEQELLGWTAKRELSKINYRIHTDAIKSHPIPEEITSAQASVIYAEEADVLNVAMFGMTAKQWREANPDLKGNIRDYATINELICLSNMENINAVLISDGVPQGERLVKLNQIAIQQMQVLEGDNNRNLLK